MTSRSRSGPRDVREIARSASGLQQALRRAETYLALNARLAPALPEPLRAHLRVACIEGETLVLAAGSPAWATQARMHQASLLEVAKALWPQPLANVRVIVAPGLEAPAG
ncbi:DciA family protein [Halomonas denitrificans]|nr:DUF721 domain-containing protein [Halomonas denitrificans]